MHPTTKQDYGSNRKNKNGQGENGRVRQQDQPTHKFFDNRQLKDTAKTLPEILNQPCGYQIGKENVITDAEHRMDNQ